MALDPRTPVLVGAGQVTARPEPGRPLTERAEPADLMAEAVRLAAADCGGAGAGGRLLGRLDSIRVVLPVSWHYANPGLLVAQRLALDPAEQVLSRIGGNTPLAMAAAAAAEIAEGRLDVAVICGGEALHTRLAARRESERPVLPWTVQPADTPAPVPYGTDREPVTEVELERGLDRPSTVFPLFEIALRAKAGEGVEEHRKRLGSLWARFSEVAAENPHAWSRQARTAEEIVTAGPENRMVTFPYTKLMNANDRVDQGAALLLCSVAAARAAGVPPERWVFPLAVAEANDHWFLSHRQDLASSPAIAAAGSRALELAGVGIDEVALVDLYSCFPCAVQLGAAALGLDPSDPGRPPTVTGGLGFAGGPVNNYVTHSIATMASRLREAPGAVGLVSALGWYATKHAVGLWSTEPPAGGFRADSAQGAVDTSPQRAPASGYEGEVTVETYAVVHERAGGPERAVLALLTPDGRRAWGNVGDPDLLERLEVEDLCGRPARLRGDGRVDLR